MKWLRSTGGGGTPPLSDPKWGGVPGSTAVFFEELLHFESRHAPRPRSRDRLPVPALLDVAAGKHPGHPGEDVVVGLDVPVRVEIDLALEHARIRDMPD